MPIAFADSWQLKINLLLSEGWRAKLFALNSEGATVEFEQPKPVISRDLLLTCCIVTERLPLLASNGLVQR